MHVVQEFWVIWKLFLTACNDFPFYFIDVRKRLTKVPLQLLTIQMEENNRSYKIKRQSKNDNEKQLLQFTNLDIMMKKS